MATLRKLLKNTFFNLFLILVFTAAALWFILHKDFNQVMTSLAKLNKLWLLVLALYMMGYHFIIGMIITVLTRLFKKDYRKRQGFVNALIASFFHGITPSSTGGQFFQLYVFRHQGIGLSDAANVLWLDFILYQSTRIGLVFAFLLIRYPALNARYHFNIMTLIVLGFLVNAGVIVALWVLTRFRKPYIWLTSTGVELVKRLHLTKDANALKAKIVEGVDRFRAELTRVRSYPHVLLQAILLNACRLTVAYFFPVVCAWALGIDLSFIQVIDMFTLTACVFLINAFIPIPGSSGGTEMTFLMFIGAILSPVAVKSDLLLWRFFSYHFIMVAGSLLFAWFRHQVNVKENSAP
ncbi:MAG: flippase-like domain-containing protein [Erysipelotrichaceae bacterium]|jgi:uncharacterized protein (TIRG00374 family)|nr:flippase-like domain-containing protein [Erysipelotrichaceae bacterium]